MSIPIFVFVLLAATLVALLEIQIEGPAGWAKNLPTWRSKPEKWYSKFAQTALNKEELTGYHLALWTTVLLFFHIPFFFGIPWGITLEKNLIASYFLFWMLEDFLWFIFNPAFGIKKFKPQYIPWHKKWIGPFPKTYYTGLILVLILYYI